MKIDIEKIKKELPRLGENSDYSRDVKDYLRFYGLDLANETIKHLFGTFKSGEFTLCGHIFKPANYKATAIIVHGYTAHCGLLNKIIKELLGCGFAVCCFDWPGHGLSDGERSKINDFSQYSNCLADFMNAIRAYVKAPYHLIGHSMGGAIVMDYLSADREDCFDKVVLAAPLVRCADWKMSKFLFPICRRLFERMPRIYRKLSSDKEFLNFLKYQDPLNLKSFSLKWVDAMFEWSERITGKNPAIVMAGLTKPILIIQGTKDNIVDWRYNLRAITSKFHDCDVELIENARHELFNESPQYRDEVFSIMTGYLRR